MIVKLIFLSIILIICAYGFGYKNGIDGTYSYLEKEGKIFSKDDLKKLIK